MTGPLLIPRSCILIGGAMATAVLAGCSARDLPPLARAGGVVFYDDQPLAGATVSFLPDGSKGTKGRMAIGSTGADGRFVLRSFAADDGAIVGCHRVIVTAMDAVPEEVASAVDGQPQPPRPLKSRIPVRYNDPATSEFTAEVKPRTANEFEFRLTSEK